MAKTNRKNLTEITLICLGFFHSSVARFSRPIIVIIIFLTSLRIIVIKEIIYCLYYLYPTVNVCEGDMRAIIKERKVRKKSINSCLSRINDIMPETFIYRLKEID